MNTYYIESNLKNYFELKGNYRIQEFGATSCILVDQTFTVSVKAQQVRIREMKDEFVSITFKGLHSIEVSTTREN
ncbi:hypothetical protein ACFO0S_13665 [Chryseomicrobium palamuruense]|uniref:DUF2187 domain-containing protein n=1 Tax=Chryseomicrobium palamuruense TaxID=682973 RepID=A0ABV8UZX7_9BACL